MRERAESTWPDGLRDLSFVFQTLDNSTTLFDPDPTLRDRFPNDSDAELIRRVRIESALVKIHGIEVRWSRGPVARLLDGPTPRVSLVIDGDAFVIEFALDQRDEAGRESAVLCFGYLPRGEGFEQELERLWDFFCKAGVTRTRELYDESRRRLEFALNAVARAPVGPQRRGPFEDRNDLEKFEPGHTDLDSDLPPDPDLAGDPHFPGDASPTEPAPPRASGPAAAASCPTPPDVEE